MGVRRVLLLVVLAASLVACGGGGASDPTQVVVTTAPPVSTTQPGVIAAVTPNTLTASDTTLSEDLLPILVEVDIPYSTQFALDVYHPNAAGPWPVAVVFQGGEEPKSRMRTYASHVAERGVVVFVPEYSSTPDQLSDGLHLVGAPTHQQHPGEDQEARS